MTQVNRLKGLVYLFSGARIHFSLEPKVVETEKVLNGLVRALRDT